MRHQQRSSWNPDNFHENRANRMPLSHLVRCAALNWIFKMATVSLRCRVNQGKETQISDFKETVDVLCDCHFAQNMLLIPYAEAWELTQCHNEIFCVSNDGNCVGCLQQPTQGVRSLLVSFEDSDVWPDGLLQAPVLFYHHRFGAWITHWFLWTVITHPCLNFHGGLYILIMVWIIFVSKRSAWGPFYKHDLTLIPAWISNYIHHKVWDKIIYPLSNFTGKTFEVWEWMSNLIPHVSGHVITYSCWD